VNYMIAYGSQKLQAREEDISLDIYFIPKKTADYLFTAGS